MVDLVTLMNIYYKRLFKDKVYDQANFIENLNEIFCKILERSSTIIRSNKNAVG